MSLATVERLQSKLLKSFRTKAFAKTGRAIAGLTIGLFLCLVANGKAEAISFQLTKIADNNTLIPKGTGNFGSFREPVLDNGNVAFTGFGANEAGFYISVDGSLRLVADTNTPLPVSTNNLYQLSLGNPSLDNRTVAFTSSILFYGGVYQKPNNSALQRIIDSNTSVPNVGRFVQFSNVSVDNSKAAFLAYFYKTGIGSARPFTGIFTNVSGSLKLIAQAYLGYSYCVDQRFSSLGSYMLEDRLVAFVGDGYCNEADPTPRAAIMAASGDRLQVLVDSNTLIPRGTGSFSYFPYLALDNGNIAFQGTGESEQAGIYTKIGRALNVVADTNTAIPGGTGNFANFAGVSFKSGSVAFAGIDSLSQTGIYTNFGGSLTKVIASNDSLDGKTVQSVSLGNEAFSKKRIAFKAVFTDGSQVIYVATPRQ